jgi:esterase/lipase superfamily enzyme
MFTRELANEMEFAQITVSIPPDHARVVGELQWPASPPSDPRRDFVTASAEYLDRLRFGSAITTLAKAGHRQKTMVFVHGFNNRFDDAVYRFAHFVQDGRLPVVPVLFSWPSQGVANLRSSTNARSRFNRVRRWRSSSISSMPIPASRRSPCLPFHGLPGNSWVAADVFLSQWANGPQRHRIGLFLSQDDFAVKVSRSISGGTTRVGDINPEEEPFKSALAGQKLIVFDLTHLAGDNSHSGAFDKVSTVMGMLERRLAQAQQLGEDTSRMASTRWSLRPTGAI